ncbi:MAG: hypothetical protein PHD81_02800 [Candidatus Nanoarchaeia archaeon]|nr:hypothetical protein [Candidatus Nanoarchaeia archaeon]MDD5588013.1 hypothetical protein [Candidatus Nanoarchaeia archaeon]
MKRVKKRTRFFVINFDVLDKSVTKLFKPIKTAENKYFRIFKIKPKSFNIILVYSRKEFDKYVGFKTENWVDGYVKLDSLIMFSPSVKDNYLQRNVPMSYKSFFDHEINHFFYISLVGSYSPVWLGEGYACYMSDSMPSPLEKDRFRQIKNPQKFLFYKYIKKSYFRYANEFYSISFYVVTYLIENYGHNKILKLIKRFAKKPNKNSFDKEFKQIYGITTKEAVKNSISN